MRLLLDTHVFLGLIEPETKAFPALFQWLSTQPDTELHLSVASLWEIAIKWRLGKLHLPVAPSALPELVRGLAIALIPIIAAHVLRPLQPEPSTRDPFDRLLLAQCGTENLYLLTADRALVSHPLAATSS